MEIRRRPPNPSIKVANLEYGIPHPDAEPDNILEKIVWTKDQEIELTRRRVPLDTLKSQIKDIPPSKDFLGALKNCQNRPAVIAEIKKASPSKGIIREDFDPIYIAKSYQEGGASCLSVLTDSTFFKGGFDVLKKVRKHVEIPLLCKDFILYPYQLYQARASGADAVLLIAAILSDQDLRYLSKIASSLDLCVLVEVHNEEELSRIISIGNFKLVGINNRNLKTFETDIKTTESLARKFFKPLKDQGITIVSESGIISNDDLIMVSNCGVEAVLVGEHLMRQKDILNALKNLIEN